MKQNKGWIFHVVVWAACVLIGLFSVGASNAQDKNIVTMGGESPWRYDRDGYKVFKYSTDGSQPVIIGDGSGNTVAITSDGQLHTVMQGAECTNNSTETPLAEDGVFTGIGTDISNYAALSILIHTDVASATDGLDVQFSSDNADWHSAEQYTLVGGADKFFTPPVQALYFRVIYTNGPVAQTEFHLHVVKHKVPIKWSSHNANDNLSDEDDGELVIAVPKLRTAQNNYVSMAATGSGNAKISIEERENTIIFDDMLEIARGNIQGITHVNKFGLAVDGVQTAGSDIWDRADSSATQNTFLAPTAARIHTLVSTSTADDGTPEGAGAGAQAVRVWYLPDWDTKETYEDVILNGTAGVAMNNAAVIIHRIKTIEVGSTYNVNVGTITATAATDATITAQVNPTEGQTQMAIYGIPSVQSAYMTGWTVNAHNPANPGTASEVDFSVWINEHPDLNTTDFIRKANTGTRSTGNTDPVRNYRPYFSISTPAIVKIRGVASAADIEGSAEFDIILVDN